MFRALRATTLLIGFLLLSGCRKEETPAPSAGPPPPDPEAILAKGGPYWSSASKVAVKAGGKERKVEGGDQYFIWPADLAGRPSAKAGRVALRLHWKHRGAETGNEEIFAWISTEGDLKDNEGSFFFSAWDPSLTFKGNEGDVDVGFNMPQKMPRGEVNMLLYLQQGTAGKMLSNILRVKVNFP